MDKADILGAIRRIAAANKGKPPGRQRFEAESGIKYHDWYGRYWARWGDALREAGFAENALAARLSDDEIVRPVIALMRELSRLPVSGELRMKAKTTPEFPSDLSPNFHPAKC